MTEGAESHNDYIAAIDLGSNSFHMIVGRIVDGQLKIVDRLREPVRLAAGLMSDGTLDQDARERAMACFARFGERLSSFKLGSVRAVGTNTLRKAKKTEGFIEEAESLLGHRIHIISGVEEARLIHLGVIHNIDLADERHLVIDIGGGSTEFIIGESAEPLYLESLYMGCVSFSEKYFKNGVDEGSWQKANLAAQLELYPVAGRFRQLGWKKVFGTSGTIKAIGKIAVANGWTKDGITLEAIKKLKNIILNQPKDKKLELPGLSKEREPVLPGGVAVLEAIFESLKIKQLRVSEHSLREGLLHDIVGRITHKDVRHASVINMMEQYQCDKAQADRVASTVSLLHSMAKTCCQLKPVKDEKILFWAAQLHELGQAIAHSQYHKHGAYIVEFADMPGFTRMEQKILALLIRNHRRKIAADVLNGFQRKPMERVKCLVFILRMAVLFNRNRVDFDLPEVGLSIKKDQYSLILSKDWLSSHPLTKADLVQEVKYLKGLKVSLLVVNESGQNLV